MAGLVQPLQGFDRGRLLGQRLLVNLRVLEEGASLRRRHARHRATKAAAIALVKGWARDLGSRGILVNAIQPGPVDTELNPADGPFFEPVSALTALNRYGKPAEIANLAAFLASDRASYITGSALDVDGGMGL